MLNELFFYFVGGTGIYGDGLSVQWKFSDITYEDNVTIVVLASLGYWSFIFLHHICGKITITVSNPSTRTSRISPARVET